MRVKHLCLLYLLLFFSFAAHGQQYSIIHWGIEDGLSQGINQKIIKDSEGFIWATSYEGVNRFDGKNFLNFYPIPKKRNSIRGIETVGLVLDSLNKIWIGSGDGLNRYDPVTDSVKNFFVEKNPDSRSQYIVPVAATNDEVICFDINGAVSGYNINTFNRRIITKRINWFTNYSNVNNSWLESKNEILWMPVEKGLAAIELKTGNTTFYFTDTRINSISFNKNKKLFFAGTDDGIIEFDSAGNNIHFTKTFLEIPIGKVNSTVTDDFFNTWIGTEEHGLFIKAPDNSINHLVKTNSSVNSINDNKINSIYCDKTGIVWAGAGTNGLNQLIPGNRFTHFSETNMTPNSLNNNIVRCFLEDEKKNIWIGTQGGGINIFNPATQKFSSLNKTTLSGLSSNLIRSMVKDDKDFVWIGTEKGMCHVNMNSLHVNKINFVRQKNQPLPDPYIEQIIRFTDSSWLIATKEFGLFELGKESTNARQLSFPGDKHVFYSAFINKLLFVSVWDDDPKIFSIQNSEWKPLKKDITSSLITYVLHDAGKKKYWIGTLKGLLETDDDLNILHHYTMEDGLSNHYIYSMVLDKDKKLWMSTNKGISQFSTNIKTFRTFTPADGLQGYEYNAKATFISSDGTIYFGGTNGFDVIKNVESPMGNNSSAFYIKNLLINNREFSGSKSIAYTNKIRLPYNSNNITLQTGVIDFVIRGNNRIKYKLEGADKDWRIAGRDFIINYSGLAPGHYTFMATASNSNDEWEEKTTSLIIIITPPWWQTWWFITGIGILATGILIAGIRFYYRRKLEAQKIVLENQKAIEKERTRIATDMHDDLGAGLSRIKFLSETIGIKKQQQQSIDEDISSIKEYSHEMIDKMGEIVWALNEKNDSLSDLLAYTRVYAVEYLSQNGINCIAEIPDNLPDHFVGGEFRRNIYLTVKEALHNVVKHSQASEVIITIKVSKTISIQIQDNGNGFDKKNIRAYSNGLSNMEKRIREIGGELIIENEKGTTIKFTVPLAV